MSKEEKAEGVAPRARPFITLAIKKGSRLLEGRLPMARRKRGDELEVDLDPVPFAALLASAGRSFTVDQVAEEIAGLRRSEQADKHEDEGSFEEGDTRGPVLSVAGKTIRAQRPTP